MSGRYADLLTIQADLTFVHDAALRYASIHGDADHVLVRALWSAAVVSYRRCFNSGKGHGLIQRSRLVISGQELAVLSESQREVHQIALEQADKHVAHHVNIEQNQMPIHLLFHRDASGTQELAGITSLGALYLGPLPDQALLLADIAVQLGANLQSLADAKRDEILARAGSLLAM
jgi:hypothetical protein